MTHHPFQPPVPKAFSPRTPANRLVRAAALLFLPPLAAVWLWRSRRLHVAVKVVLTVCCVFGTFFWIGVIAGPQKKPQPVATPVTASQTVSPTPSATPTATPTASETPAPAPTPLATEAPRPALMPDVARHTAVEARALLVAAGVTADRIHEASRYQDLPLPAAHEAWVACANELPPGSALTPGTEATLRLVRPGASCPADGQQALYADERNNPSSPSHQDASGSGGSSGSGSSAGGSSGSGSGGTTGGTSGSTSGGTTGGSSGASSGSASGGTSGGGSAYFKNCAEAKAAGKAPLHRGDPGYRAALDGDGDGVACER